MKRSAAIRWIALVLAVAVAAVAADSAVAWAYVLKRQRVDYPIVGLLDRYYVLRPFRDWFPGQYLFPAVLRPNLLGELGQQWVWRAFWLADPILGQRHAPNALVLEENYTWRATNAQGLIVTDPDDPLHVYAIPKPGNVFRILILGSSFVEADGATGSLTSLPARLLAKLRAAYAPVGAGQTEFEVINAAVGGYTSQQELLFYLSELRSLQPDLVVTVDGYADLVYINQLMARFGPDYPRMFNEATEGQTRALNDSHDWWAVAGSFGPLVVTRIKEVLSRVAMFDVLNRALGKVVALGAKASAGAAGAPAPAAPFFPESAARYREYETELARAVVADGGRFAWFLQPVGGLRHEPNYPREIGYVQQNQAALQIRKQFFDLAHAGQIQTVAEFPAGQVCAADVTDVFEAVPLVVWEDFLHMFDRGHLLLADRLAIELEHCGFVRTK